MTIEEAINELFWIREDENDLKGKEALNMAIKSLEQTEPERKTGKWEYIQYDGNPKIGNWHCSNCRLIVNLGFEGAPYYHYCPSCGTRMEVDNG
jgi:rubrerythrin